MALKRCVKCKDPAHKMLDGRLYCKECVLEMEMPKEAKRACSCECKEVAKEEPKKKWWEKALERLGEPLQW